MKNYHLGPVQLFTITVQIHLADIRPHYAGEISKLCFYSESA